MKREELESVTVEEILSWDPCNPWPEEIRKRAGSRKRFTVIEIIARCKDVPASDLFWLVLRDELIPAATLREFACRCAERALRRERAAGREPDERSWAAIRATRLFLRGKIGPQEWDAARDAAGAAAEASARSAARAARDAAGAAAGAAASSAAEAAARSPAWAAEQKWQRASLRRLLSRPPKWLSEVNP